MSRPNPDDVIVLLIDCISNSKRVQWNLELPENHPLINLADECRVRGLYPRTVPPPTLLQTSLQIVCAEEFCDLQFQWLMFWSCFGAWHNSHSGYNYQHDMSPDSAFTWSKTLSSQLFQEWDRHYDELNSDGDDDDEDDDDF